MDIILVTLATTAMISAIVAVGLDLLLRGKRPVLVGMLSPLVVPAGFLGLCVWGVQQPNPLHRDGPWMALAGAVIYFPLLFLAGLLGSAAVVIGLRRWREGRATGASSGAA